MSFQAFLHEIEKGLPASVYLLYASDPFLRREAREAIKKLVPEEERDFNLHIFDLSLRGEEGLSFEQILDVANTVSFFGKRRFVLLAGNLERLSKKELKELDAYLSNPAPGSVFVILHERVLNKELRERFSPPKAKSKTIYLDIKEAEIPYWLKHRARIKGLEMSDKVADYLIGLIGPDLGLLSAELEKISLLGKQSVDVNDISEIITGGRSYTVFDLVDAIIKKDAERVFRIYKVLKETVEDYELIGVLRWHYEKNLPSSTIFELLNSADIDIKSSGRTFPMEYLLIKLLRL
jgi:DNA polymerase-3 subunit delta